MDVYVTGEPAGAWETATGNTEEHTYEIDVSQYTISNDEELQAYMNAHANAIPYIMQDGRKIYLREAKLPQNNTSVSITAISNLVQATGGILASYNTRGMIILITAAQALSAIMGAQWLGIQAGQVAQENIARLEQKLAPYGVGEDGDIPVYVDETGTGYVLADCIEAVRQGLIEMGAYRESTEVPEEVVTEDFTVRFNASIPVIVMEPGITYSFEGRYGRRDFTITSSISPVYMWAFNEGSYSSQARICSKASFAGTLYNSYSHSTSSITAQQSYSGRPMMFWGYSVGLSSASDWSSLPAGLTWVPSSAIPSPQTIAGSSINTKSVIGDIGVTYGTEIGGGIAGTTVSSDIPVGYADGSLSLDDVLPDWYARARSLATPDDSDIFLKSPALPLNVPLDNVWEDGYAGDSADAEDGDLADILKNAIVAAIPNILADIIADTAATYDDIYNIPVGDGGDTPPPVPPVLDGSSNGLWTMYAPDKQEVNAFGAWLWSDTIIDQIIRQFNSPIDAIIGFHQIYCTPDKGADKVIKAGYLNSPVSAPEITNQYKTINCGTVHVDEFYGNVLDYDNTQVSIYLPFVGIVPLNTNIVMGSDLEVIYRIDVFTGTCLAQIVVHKDNSHAVMYAFEGNCAVQIPLTATTYTGMIGALISGISAGVSFMEGDMLHATSSGLSAVMSGLTGRTGTKQSGSMGSNAGSLGIRKPYLIITRAISAMPAGFESVAGLPSTEFTALSSVSGFTVVRNVHLEGIPGTAEELEEIKGLLESGVIF